MSTAQLPTYDAYMQEAAKQVATARSHLAMATATPDAPGTMDRVHVALRCYGSAHRLYATVGRFDLDDAQRAALAVAHAAARKLSRDIGARFL